MKQPSKTLLWVAVALVALGAVLIAFGSHGTSFGELWNNGGFSIGTVSVGKLDANYKVCETGREDFSADGIKRLDIGWIAGSVKLQSGAGKTFALAETARRELKDGEKLRWKIENGTLFVRYCDNGMKNIPEKDLILTVPADWLAEDVVVDATSADIDVRGLQVGKKLTVDVTSGDIRLADCVCDSLALGATSGGISAESCRCDKLEAGTTSGGVSLLDCVCRTLEAGATSGDIAVRCESEAIRLDTTSGSIRCEDVPARCHVNCGATSGAVRISLREAGDEQRIEVETTSGDVYLDAPGAIELDYDTASGDLRGKLRQGGDGCPQVRVDTTSGDLILGGLEG